MRARCKNAHFILTLHLAPPAAFFMT